MAGVDNCLHCGVPDRRCDPFDDPDYFDCSCCACYGCAHLHDCSGQCASQT